MSEQDEQARLQAKLKSDFHEMISYVTSGSCPGFVLITHGEGGKTMMSGDPGTIVISLETAKALVVNGQLEMAAKRAQEREEQEAHVLYEMPSQGQA